MKRVALAVMPLVLLTACGGGSSSKPIDVHGSLKLTSDVSQEDGIEDSTTFISDSSNIDQQAKAGDECSGNNGYNDLQQGAQVVISDDSGKTLATGALSAGKLEKEGNHANVCGFSFDLANVATKSKYYSIKIGHRDGPKQEVADLKAGPELRIGDN